MKTVKNPFEQGVETGRRLYTETVLPLSDIMLPVAHFTGKCLGSVRVMDLLGIPEPPELKPTYSGLVERCSVLQDHLLKADLALKTHGVDALSRDKFLSLYKQWYDKGLLVIGALESYFDNKLTVAELHQALSKAMLK